jgi:hypothetical protein
VLGTEPAPDSARTPGRTGEDDARRLRPRAEKARPEEVAVRVGSIEFDGLPAGAPSADELLELDVAVAQNESGDLQGASAPSAQRLRLRELAGGETAPRLDGSLLQAIVERIADEYAARGRYGTRIGIQKRALQELVDGRTAALHIQIEAPPGAP